MYECCTNKALTNNDTIPLHPVSKYVIIRLITHCTGMFHTYYNSSVYIIGEYGAHFLQPRITYNQCYVISLMLNLAVTYFYMPRSQRPTRCGH